MTEKFENIKKQLPELASMLNAFKSEAVQLRIVDFILGSPTEPLPQDKKTPKKTAGRKAKVKEEGGGAPGKKKKAPAGTGAAATLTQLLGGNFFDKSRTINDIIEHCKHNLARTFKANEFSGKLGRMVRNGELTRKKNADNPYEYKKT